MKLLIMQVSSTSYHVISLLSKYNPRMATGYGLDVQRVGVEVPVEARMFTSPCRPEQLWGPLRLLSNGYWGLFPRGKAAGS
jgi:hypothetical protein